MKHSLMTPHHTDHVHKRYILFLVIQQLVAYELHFTTLPIKKPKRSLFYQIFYRLVL